MKADVMRDPNSPSVLKHIVATFYSHRSLCGIKTNWLWMKVQPRLVDMNEVCEQCTTIYKQSMEQVRTYNNPNFR